MQSSQGKIERLELYNFKSYKGFHSIGPFSNFTAIVGPNGAGKSNLTDSLSFALGVKAAHLRARQLSDLIYAFDQTELSSDRTAFVCLVWKAKDGTEVKFCREVKGNKGSEYWIDRKTVSWDEYCGKPKDLGVLVKARNFLIFQGDVESIASKTPKELTYLIEQISGSDELKKDYNNFNAQMIKAQEKSELIYSEKRNIFLEKKQKKLEKKEAERHLHLQEELKLVKTKYFVRQLSNIERELERIDAEIEEERESVAQLKESEKECKFEIDAKKKEKSTLQKRINSAEMYIAKRKHQLDKKEPEILKLKEQVSRLKSKMEKCSKELAKKKNEEKKQSEEIEKLKREFEAIKNEIALLNQDEQGKLQLADDQLMKYYQIKEEAGIRTAKLKDEKEVYERQLNADVESHQNIEQNLRQLQDRKNEISSQNDELKSKLVEIQFAISNRQDSLVLLRRNLAEISEQKITTASKYNNLKHSLEKTEAELAELKAHKIQSERDLQLSEIARNLKRIFPKVYGRMSELCSISQEKYRVPVSVAMRKFKDAIVVQDENTGKECIKYLKEQRLPAQSFVPLELVRVKPVSEKLRSLGGTAKLIIDIIQFDRMFEKAVLYAVGNTLVCDKLDEAKTLSWSKGERFRVVTVEGGALITKSGTMTGGMSQETETRSDKWDSGKIEDLKKMKAQIEEELKELKSPREFQKEEIEIFEKISGLERKIHHLKVEENNLLERISQLESEKSAINEHISRVEPELHKLASCILNKKEEVKKLEKQINEIIDRIYNDFSILVGVKNIREYEEKHLIFQEKKLKLNNQITALKYQLEYEQKRDIKAPVKTLEATHDSLNEQLNNLLQMECKAKLEIEKISEEINILKGEADDCKTESDEYDKKLNNLIKKDADITADITELESQTKSKEGVLQRLDRTKHDINDRCKMEQLQIDKTLEIDKNTDDFYFTHKIDFLTAEINRTAPNLKSLDQYETLLQKEKDVTNKYEFARNEEKEITDKFNTVRQKRYSLFMDAFTHISAKIDSTYKALTHTKTHPLGGTAYLNLENEDEPYLYGIKYTAMPPTKRFCSIGQLSGGERSVAGLALLFAVHSFRPAPFFILDEVDAALDNVNVSKIASFIRSKSCTNDSQNGPGFQSIIISQKDSLYHKANSLIGVFRDSDNDCSRTLTFDLTRCNGD